MMPWAIQDLKKYKIYRRQETGIKFTFCFLESNLDGSSSAEELYKPGGAPHSTDKANVVIH